MRTESLTRLGSTHTVVFLKADITRSKKEDLFLAKLLGIPGMVEAPAFYMDTPTVRVKPLGIGETAQGEVMALLFAEEGASLDVQVLGDAIGFGPNLSVPRSAAA